MEPWLVAIVASVAFAGALLGLRRSRRTVARMLAAAGASSTAEPIGAVNALRDEADRTAQELAAERHDHDLLLEWLAQGLILIDRDLRIVAANAAAHGFLDRQPGSLMGRTVIEAFLDAQVETLARTALDQGSAVGEMARPDPAARRLLIRARRSAAGGAWLVLEDVSELRRLQQIRAEFIDNLSHELRTPLTTVSLLAETLTREAEAAADVIPLKMRDRIGKIEVETGHLVQMVSELLDLSRIESGGSIGAVDQLDLGQIATDSIERLRLFADRQGVTLRVDRHPPLPSVQGDEERIGQVFVNLLHNAVKFSPDGGEVTVSVRAEAGRVVTSIADHGVGIPKAAQARIFERFYKVDRARVRGETGGTGLGLAIARHIVEQHGGTIWVESTEGVGSTFSFGLPIPAEP
ncbi:MAG: PAS domain-containing protein [Chloroflexi bacterium]|nr:PAS domain-containing protein [Chloroflexota bacterium]